MERAQAGLLVSANRPVKGLWIQGVGLADNFIDLVPDAPRMLAVQGPLPSTLRCVALCHAAWEEAVQG